MRWAKTLPVNSVIFNLRGRSYIDCMFYTPFTAYNFIPDHSQYLELKSKHQKYMIVIVNISREECPEYLKNDPSVVFMKDITSCCDC
jgi:4-amino-4-deoxy-L-arabinose transferase